MKNYSPFIINKSCLVINSLPVIFFIVLQLSGINSWGYFNKFVLKILFVINLGLIIWALFYLFIRVTGIKSQLKKDILCYAKKMLCSANEEDDPLEWLTALKEELPRNNMHNKFLMRYCICFISMIFGFAGVYRLIYLINVNSFYFNPPKDNLARVSDFIYFSFVTITTSSYGDMIPITFVTKLFTMFQISIGIVFLVIMLDIYFASRDELNKIMGEVVNEVRVFIEEEEKKSVKLKSKRQSIKKRLKEEQNWTG